MELLICACGVVFSKCKCGARGQAKVIDNVYFYWLIYMSVICVIYAYFN